MLMLDQALTWEELSEHIEKNGFGPGFLYWRPKPEKFTYKLYGEEILNVQVTLFKNENRLCADT